MCPMCLCVKKKYYSIPHRRRELWQIAASEYVDKLFEGTTENSASETQ